MLGHAALLALVKRRAVKVGKAVLILGEMRRDPVHDHADIIPVQSVDQIGKVFRSAVTGSRRVIARDLIAPGGVERILHQRHQLDMRIAHLLAVLRKSVRQIAVLCAFIAERFPRAGVQLVNAHRAVHKVALRAFFHIRPVCPLVMVVIDHGRIVAAVLRPCSKGIGLPYDLAVCLGHRKLVQSAQSDVLNKDGPYAALDALHRRGRRVPSVELAHQTDGSGVRCPEEEAMKPDLRDITAAEAKPGFLRVACIKKKDIILRDILHQLVVHAVFSFAVSIVRILLYLLFPSSSSLSSVFRPFFYHSFPPLRSSHARKAGPHRIYSFDTKRQTSVLFPSRCISAKKRQNRI